MGPCREFEGNCADIIAQFADVPVLPDYPDGMSTYFCTQFPDDDQSIDSFIVGLISIAVAVPVTYFLQVCFEIGNDNEAPESWLTWSFSWRKLVFGMHAHRRWHYTGPLGQPHRHVKWFIRSVDAPLPETYANLWRSFYAWLTNTEPPWIEEAREAAEEEAEEAACVEAQRAPRRSLVRISTHSNGHTGGGGDAVLAAGDVARDSGSSYSFSISQSQHSAAELQRYKRVVTALGVIGTYITWAIFAWCVRVSYVQAACSQVDWG